MKEKVCCAMVGNPNVGKSSIFNALTNKACSDIGNWEGVTTDIKSELFTLQRDTIKLYDLPGLDNFSIISRGGEILEDSDISYDQNITLSFLREGECDTFIYVTDYKNLYSAIISLSYLSRLKKSIILVINKSDLAEKDGINIDIGVLQDELGLPVIMTNTIGDCCKDIKYKLSEAMSIRHICGARSGKDICSEEEIFSFADSLISLAVKRNDSIRQDSFIAKLYKLTHSLYTKRGENQANDTKNTSEVLDGILLHNLFGFATFCLIIYFILSATLLINNLFAEFIDTSTYKGIGWIKEAMPDTVYGHIICGMIFGIGVILPFIPAVFCLYFFMSILEESGYMTRVSILWKRAMSYLGLPGKASVPMILGLGCNVTAIMAARTIPDRRQRIALIMLLPFITCSARFAVFSVFCSIYYKSHGDIILASLYCIGIAATLCYALILKRFFKLEAKEDYLIMTLSDYSVPNFGSIISRSYDKLKDFFKSAALITLGLSFILHISIYSYFGKSTIKAIGCYIAKVTQYMGIGADNWEAGISLLTGMISKELIIGTTTSLYEVSKFDSNNGILSALGHILRDRFSYSAFFAYLIFILLYFPCVSVFAIISREIGLKYALASSIITTLLAYLFSVLFYQFAQFTFYAI